MIQFTYEQKSSIGLQYILERLNPSSPYGEERVRKLRPYAREEIEFLQRDLDNLEKIRMQFGHTDLVPRMNSLKRIFMRMKDVRPALKKAGQMCLNDIEFFELKNFLICCEQAGSIWNGFCGLTGVTGLQYEDTTEALNLLDPDLRRIPTFVLSDRYSETLAQIRAEKREAEKQMAAAADQNDYEQWKQKRHGIVLLEENEEQKIREYLTQSLIPFLDRISHNAAVTGEIDLLFEKVSASHWGTVVKPTILMDAPRRLTLEQAGNPWVASFLKERGQEFTPISISLEEGAGAITGANMGGKSVALKTITLNVMLALCGFFVYAEQAEIPMFDDVLMVSEELQSVKQGLSSFGAEIVQMQHVAETVEQGFCFVVLDEFARGTNPEEGAALVRAVIRYLNTKKVIALLVTHFDHVAEYARVHYQVAGLRDMDVEQVGHEIQSAGREKGVAVIARHMNYGLFRVEQDLDCPKDAFRICRLLGLTQEIMDYLD